MKKLFTIAAVLVFCACFAAAQTPGTTQPGSTTQQAGTQVEKPMLEFANANSAKIAWTSKAGADLELRYGTDAKNLTGTVNAIEKMSGDNHRASLTNLQPNTTYYAQMANKTGQPVGPVFTFKTPAQGQPPIHEQPLTPQ
jgi:hypothetical protein